ncbi:MAG: hypothetical protein ACP5KG_03045 [Myxococcota bacterium]
MISKMGEMLISELLKRYKYYLMFILVIIFSLILRLCPPLDRYGLNMMEMDYIRWITNLDGYDYLVNCAANHHGFLAPIFLKYWLLIMPEGNTDFYVRLLSVIIFLLIVFMILFIKEEALDEKTKLVSVFFISVNGLMIAFSRNARLLPLFALIIFTFFYLLYKNLGEGSVRNSIFLFLTTILALLTQPLSLIYITGISLSALLVFGIGRTTFRGFIPIICGGILVSPYYFWLFSYGKTESELFPLSYKIIIEWLIYMVDDYDTLLILIFTLIATVRFDEILKYFQENLKKRFFRFLLFSLIICILIFIGISIFVPLTRSYYIIPLVVFSSVILGSILSRLQYKVLLFLIAILGIKALLSFCIFEKQIIAFWSSYGMEKEVLLSFRDSDIYKGIERRKSIFINLPVYYTRAFDYYKSKDEDYFPHLDRYGYVEEIYNLEKIRDNLNQRDFYLILWEDCNKVKDPHQKNLCNINLAALEQIFIKELVWEYQFKKQQKYIKVFRLTGREGL